MLLRLLPYILILGVGFVAAAILLRRTGPSASAWEAKYREMFDRYRELTRQLKGVEERGEAKAARLRQRLHEVSQTLRASSGNADEALRRIDRALQEDRET